MPKKRYVRHSGTDTTTHSYILCQIYTRTTINCIERWYRVQTGIKCLRSLAQYWCHPLSGARPNVPRAGDTIQLRPIILMCSLIHDFPTDITGMRCTLNRVANILFILLRWEQREVGLGSRLLLRERRRVLGREFRAWTLHCRGFEVSYPTMRPRNWRKRVLLLWVTVVAGVVYVALKVGGRVKA